MAVAFGETEGEEERFTAACKPLATEWCEDERFPDVGGFQVSISHGLDAAAIKLKAMPHSAFGHVFVGVFDDKDLVEGGFNAAFGMEKCAKIIGGAMIGDLAMAAQFAAIGDGLELHISAPVLYFEANYKLKLVRVQVDAATVKLRKDLAATVLQLADAKKELTQTKAVLLGATEDGDAAKQQLAEAMTEIGELKAAMEELREANEKAKAKAHATAERSAVVDFSTESLIHEAIKKVVDEWTDSAFVFDTTTKGGSKTDPSKWDVCDDGKSATALGKYNQIVIWPPIRSDSELTIYLETKRSWIGVGVTDDYNKWLDYGCRFDSDGDVRVKGSVVKKSQAFGDWHSGDRLFVSVNLSRGTVSIRAPNGEFTQKWTPSSSPIWFVVYSNKAGTELCLID